MIHGSSYAAPSSYMSGEYAALFKKIRSRARTAELDARGVPVIPRAAEEKKTIRLDGTVYLLKRTWIPDPSIARRRYTTCQTLDDRNQIAVIIKNWEIKDNGVKAIGSTRDTSTQCNILQELLFSS